MLDPAQLPARSAYAIPEDKYVFACFNQIYKIDPHTFDTWMSVLKRVPNSVLWLLRFPPVGEANVRREARARGVRDDQIHFTDVASKEEHVKRGYLADLFLDTPQCNAHTTGCDILWGGTPMVTLLGHKMATRVAASELRAAGEIELTRDGSRESWRQPAGAQAFLYQRSAVLKPLFCRRPRHRSFADGHQLSERNVGWCWAAQLLGGSKSAAVERIAFNADAQRCV